MKRTVFYIITLFLFAFLLGSIVTQWFLTFNVQKEETVEYSLFKEVREVVELAIFPEYTSNKQEVEYNLIKGYLQSFHDPHTQFFTKKEGEDFKELIEGDFEGIGAFVGVHELGVQIERLISGAPAKKAGILSGDIIVQVDEEKLSGKSIYDSIALIRGPRGSVVRLYVLREEEEEVLEVEVVRWEVDIPTVQWEVVDGVGHLVVTSFAANTPGLFREELGELLEQDIRGLIIDLRDNGWGLLFTAVDLMSYFFESEQPLVFIHNQDGSEDVINSKMQNYVDLPLVVLVNENSASASEIFAGVVQDYSRGVVIGKTTFWKGSVQEFFSLSDGSEVKITTSLWFTPLKQKIEGIGVVPDIEVDYSFKDFKENIDPQLERALGVFLELEKQDIKGFLKQKNEI